MKKIKYLALTLMGIFFLAVSCKDDKELVPVWESAVTGFADVPEGGDENYVFGFPNVGVTFNWQWISADSKNTVTKVDFYVLFNEPYKDVDGNDALAEHGGDDGVFFTSLEGATLKGNRENASITITQADVYALYQSAEFDYDGSGGNPAIPVFGATPKNPDRDPTNRFVEGDIITVRWVITTADGRVFGKVSTGTGWSPSVCTEVPGSNCELTWTVVDPADSKPKATLTLKSKLNLKEGSKDTVFIAFNKAVVNAPTLGLAATNGAGATGSISAPALYKTSKTQYFAIYTAGAGYTGGVRVTASGSAISGSAPLGGLTMDPSSVTVNVDNTAPEGIGNSKINLGKGGSATIVVNFNEPMSNSKLLGDSIYVSVSGQGMDAFDDQLMTIAADGKSASILYFYKDSNGDAFAGPLTITVTGGLDVAGNPLTIVSQPQVSVDLFIPTAVTVTLSGTYDFGSQIKLASATITNAGSTSGTIYWIAIDKDATAPDQNYNPPTANRGDAPAAGALFDGFDTRGEAAGFIKASGSFSAFGASAGPRYIDFAPNGEYDLYFYVVTSTGNVGEVTVTPLQVNMALNPS